MENSPQPTSIRAAIAWLRKAFRADAAAGVHVVYRLELAGDAGGVISIRVEDGRLEIVEGAAQPPHVTYRLQACDFFGVLAGRENPDLLFMADRLAIDGDLSLALSLRKLFQSGA